MEPRAQTDRLAARCAAGGFDLAQSLSVGWYNASVEPEHRLPDFGRDDALALLVGNTRGAWPHFLDWLRERPARLEAGDPFDSFVTDTIGAAIAAEIRAPHQVRWAHRPEPHHVGFQRLAECAGLAWQSPAWLSVHPVYGPWIALRAVVVLDAPGPAQRPAPMAPCTSCDHACAPALARALRCANPGAAPGDVDYDWRRWVALRDACPRGREHRYGEQQMRYHYQRSLAALRRAVAGE